MASAARNAKIEAFFAAPTAWQQEYRALRDLALASGLDEMLKWGKPCYGLADANVVLIHGFKDYCALLFFKGALMTDPAGLLIQQTDNVQAARQLRFASLGEIEARANVISAYITEAAEIERAGMKVTFRPTEAFPAPAEWLERRAQDPAIAEAFDRLTPGRQRAWLLHFSGAQQSKTRISRIEKARDAILSGRGPNE